MFVMSKTASSTREPQRVHLHAYERLSRLCAEIQRGHYPTKAQLAHVVERSSRTVQNDLRALVNDFDAPLPLILSRTAGISPIQPGVFHLSL
jgi:hypothetical protein